MAALDQLVDRYKPDAPIYMSLSQRMVLEALIDHAVRTELPFSELFQMPASVESDAAV